MAAVLTASLAGGCSLVPGFPGDPSRVGPAFVLGPVPAFELDAPDAGRLMFYETCDGWCTEFDDGKMCAGGGGPGRDPAPASGSDDAPVNAFAACWGQGIRFGDIDVTAFDAAGNEMHGVGP